MREQASSSVDREGRHGLRFATRRSTGATFRQRQIHKARKLSNIVNSALGGFGRAYTAGQLRSGCTGGSGGTDRPEIRGANGSFRLLSGANTSGVGFMYPREFCRP